MAFSGISRIGALVAVIAAANAVADGPAKKADASARRVTHIAQPLLTPDAWETNLRACATEFKVRPKCLTELLLQVPPRLLPNFESAAEQVTTELSKWIGKDELATVYQVKEQTLGEWMTVRSFVLEDSQGNVRLLRIAFRRVVGQWWLHAFRLVDGKDIEKALGIDAP